MKVAECYAGPLERNSITCIQRNLRVCAMQADNSPFKETTSWMPKGVNRISRSLMSSAGWVQSWSRENISYPHISWMVPKHSLLFLHFRVLTEDCRFSQQGSQSSKKHSVSSSHLAFFGQGSMTPIGWFPNETGPCHQNSLRNFWLQLRESYQQITRCVNIISCIP